MNTLARSLQDHPLAMLRAIAELNGVALSSNKARQVVEELAATLSDVRHLDALLAGCTPEAREALAALQRSGNSMPVAVFERRFGTLRAFGPGRLEREHPQRAPASAAEALWFRGLVYRAFAQTPDGPVEFLYAPEDLAKLLPLPAPVSSSFRVPHAARPAQRLAAGHAGAQDACTLLGLVQAGQMRLSEDSNPLAWRSQSLYELNRLLLQRSARPELLDQAPATPAALLATLAWDLGWLQVRRFRLHLNAGEARAWLEAPRSRQRHALWNAWTASTRWNDLCRTPALCCEETGSWSNDPAATRARLLPLLGSLQAGQWHRLDDLVAAVKHHDPDFQRPDGDFDTWYIRRRDATVYLRGWEHWDVVEGELLRFLLTGPLYWLGAVQLGHGPDGHQEPDAFLVEPQGAAWLAGNQGHEEDESGTLRVQPDYTVLVPWNAPLLDRFQVMRFTTWEDVEPWHGSPEHEPPPFRYRISQSGLQRAQSQGIDADRILAFLQERSADQVPANVSRGLQRWHG